jgi:hypothetical protein
MIDEKLAAAVDRLSEALAEAADALTAGVSHRGPDGRSWVRVPGCIAEASITTLRW